VADAATPPRCRDLMVEIKGNDRAGVSRGACHGCGASSPSQEAGERREKMKEDITERLATIKLRPSYMLSPCQHVESKLYMYGTW
jgi:hypothetical protein